MMSLDKTIVHAREVAGKARKSINNAATVQGEKSCIRCAEEYEQLAEWLEDYKRLLELEKSILANEDGYLAIMCERIGYNQAIEDFVKYINECSGCTPNCIEHDISLTVYTLHQIAEQLKTGGKNENHIKKKS